MLEQLSKRNILRYYQTMYDTIGYILTLLKFYADEEGSIHKKVIKWEKFNLGRSQFYYLYKKLKDENFIDERSEHIKLKFHKVNRYLKALDKKIMEEEIF